MGNRETVGDNFFSEILEGLKKSDALALQGLSKDFNQ
jgi:hypothetical protein